MRGVTKYSLTLSHNRIISIHTPHARRDNVSKIAHLIWFFISIHTPHARRDRCNAPLVWRSSDFNPHASCEAWHFLRLSHEAIHLFQSTRLMRGVTACLALTGRRLTAFQSTRLMRGVTGVYHWFGWEIRHFNPHASCEAWPNVYISSSFKILFQSTRLMRGVTAKTHKFSTLLCAKIPKKSV